MYSCLVVSAFVLVALTATIKAEEYDEYQEKIAEIMCSEDEETKSALMECVSLLPKEHEDVVRRCVPGSEDIGDDWPEMMRQKMCQGEKPPERFHECAAEVYEENGMNMEEVIVPSFQCLHALFQKADNSEDKK